MDQIIQYQVEISCGPGPAGLAEQLLRRIQPAYPATGCQLTAQGLELQLWHTQPYAYDALKDLADLIADTLGELGVTMTTGVVRQTISHPSPHGEVLEPMQNFAASATGTTGTNRNCVTGVPVLYFYKGLRFDLDLAAHLDAVDSGRRVDPVRTA